MLNFVRRLRELVRCLREQRQTDQRKREILAFRSFMSTLTPLGYVRPTLRRVTSQNPYQGAYLEDDMRLALQPDGTPLETYLIDGYAIDNLWLGFDKATCRAYLDSLPEDSPHLLPVYAFTQEMSDLASPVLNQTMRPEIYEYLVEHKNHYLPLTTLDFRRAFLPKPTPPARSKHMLRRIA